MARNIPFQIDRNDLNQAAREALAEHSAGRMPYQQWQSVSRTIELLRKAEAFRNTHGAALNDAKHPEHDVRADELQSLFQQAYPEQ